MANGDDIMDDILLEMIKATLGHLGAQLTVSDAERVAGGGVPQVVVLSCPLVGAFITTPFVIVITMLLRLRCWSLC